MTPRTMSHVTGAPRPAARARVAALVGAAMMMLAVADAPRAELRSAKGPLELHDHARVTLRNGDIAIRGYRFMRPVRIMQKTPFVDAAPSLDVDVVNEGTQKQDFAIAVALFDRQGRLVGVGTGDHTGKLEPGETKEVKVVFRDVNQDAIRATTVQMSLELKGR
jgi:hypothetical protein